MQHCVTSWNTLILRSRTSSEPTHSLTAERTRMEASIVFKSNMLVRHLALVAMLVGAGWLALYISVQIQIKLQLY